MNLRGGQILFFLFRAGTECLWVIAAAGFTVFVTVGNPFPLIPGLLAFLGAAAVTRALSGSGLRIITILAIHIPVLTAFIYWGLDGTWPAAVPVPAGEEWRVWAWSIQTAFWIGVLWVKGVSLSRKQGTHERICSQFDLGTACFCLMLLASFVIEVRGGMAASWRGTLPLFLIFFTLSVASMGLSNPAGQKDLKAESGPGVLPVLLFGMLIAGVGTGVILLFMPLLTQGALLGAEALKNTTSPMGPILVAILQFLFGRRIREQEAPTWDPGPDASAMEWIDPGSPAAGSILGWVLGVFLGLFVAVIMFIVLYYAVKALLSKTRPGRSAPPRVLPIMEWFIRWLNRIRGVSLAGVLKTLRDPGPILLFNRLSKWGARSGLRRLSTETPMEYGLKLCNHFSGLSGDILLLVDLVNRELYAGLRPGFDHRREGLKAWRRLRSPGHWYLRLKVLLGPSDSAHASRPLETVK